MVTDDIVTRLREMATESLFGVSMAPFEYHNAADEIERLRASNARALQVLLNDEKLALESAKLVDLALEDRKKWQDWAVDYAYDDETCECDRCTAVRAAWEETQHGR